MNTIDDINFIERDARYGKQRGLFMPGNYWVGEAEITLAWEIANAHLPDIDWTKKVSTETIFTTEVWQQFWKPLKFSLGRCIKFFSVHGMLPIKVANPGKKGKILYRPRK